MEVTLEIIVRSTEIDVNGHVNNAKYLEYLEWGREEWLEQHGLYYDRILEMGAQTVTVNININYRKECRQGDVLLIKTRPVKMGRSSLVLQQEIFKKSGELAADATVTLVTIDTETRKSRPIPEEIVKLIQA